MNIAIVVLHYRNLTDTLECLDSLQTQDYPSFSILVVDNASQDENLESALAKYPQVELIRSTHNLGFAGGNNIGITHALTQGAEAILLLNNDAVAAPNLLTTFVVAAKNHPDTAVFGAKIYYYDEPTIIWHAGGDVERRTVRCYHHGCPDSDLEKKWDEVREITYACGCALFVTKEAIEKVGLMAPEFFLLWEEIDWCFRMRKEGYRCLYIPEAKVWHKISRSFEGGNRGPLWQYYYFRNRLLFLKRHFSFKERLHFYLARLPKEIFHMIGTLCHPKTPTSSRKCTLSALKGIRDSFFVR